MLQKITLFVALFISTNIFAQTPEDLLEKTRLNYTLEKVYIHFDKQNYIAGDTIWFKAYVMDGFLPSKLSTVLNVELLDAKNNVVQRKLLPITASAAVGCIALDSTIFQGSYNVVAFTKLMMNFGTTSFYNKQLNIYNAKYRENTASVDIIPEIRFLPESGNFVADIENNVAFKCVDPNGNPLPVSGKIKSSVGTEVVNFKSVHDGMGKLKFTPIFGEMYVAECMVNGKAKTVSLPKVEAGKSILKLMYSNNNAVLEVNNEKVTTDIDKADYILAVIENNIAFRLNISNEKAITKAQLPISTLPSGILKITSFNGNNQPLAERMMFINSNDYKLDASVVKSNVNTGAREKNNISFSIADTTKGSYSISITDADAEIESTDGVDNIVSRFLLTDNLTGKVNNPAYYFENPNEEKSQHLDLVMLTNGWRRYNWNTIMSNKFPSMAFKDPNYITLKGTVRRPFSTELLPKAKLLVFAKTKDSIPDIFNIGTDANAAFELSGLIFEDTSFFSFQNSTGKDRRVNLQLAATNLKDEFNVTKSFIAPYAFVWPNEKQLSQIRRLSLDKNRLFRNARELEEIVLISKAKTASEKFKEKYVTGRFAGSAGKSEDLIENPPPPGVKIFDYIQGRFAGVQVQGGPIDYQVVFRNSRTMTGGVIPMTIYLDEIEVESSVVGTMQAQDVALIRILPNSAMTGTGGALVIYTNKDRKFKSTGYTDFSTAEIVGFSATKEFYSPDYSVEFINNSIKEDVRSTLYWNPYIVLENGTKEFNLSFYNSDNAKRFRVVLEGVNANGGLLHLEKIFE
jgi:hypothetical protein